MVVLKDMLKKDEVLGWITDFQIEVGGNISSFISHILYVDDT